ncbi:unnamed protein product [Colletotrichum noveboracense]|uniref:60S ribosomal protein L27 n=1 Tax=Colletotrichum noveboracense TaxID=2664923 RepID=A0A9W4RNP7_9PEZI|nr:unnamed protein product [Colletotrichum noveboracense]
MKFLKVGRVAIITHGRYAGKKVRIQSNICEQRTQSLLSRGMEISRRRTKIGGTGWGMCIAKTKRKRRTAIDQSAFDDPDDDAEISNTARLGEIAVVIIQPVDSGNKAHPFGHALVAGIERYPSKITRRMSKTRQEKRNKIKPFVKLVNYNHLMPTRYTLELEGLKGVVSNDTFKEVTQREDAKKTVKKVLEERYTSGKNRWFFTPLSM